MKSQDEAKIIDFHAHIYDDVYFKELDEIETQMNVSKTIIVSGNMIEVGKLGDYLRGSTPLISSEPNNEYLLDIVKNNNRYAAFFTIDPNYHMKEDIEEAFELGYVGMKFNTIVHKIDFSSEELKDILPVIEDRNATIYTHITLMPHSNLEALLTLARKYKGINFVIGHMGFSTSDFAAITAAEVYDNIYLESSIGSRIAFMEIKKRKLTNKLVFGSEFPTHDPRIEYQKLKYIFDDNELDDICFNNADRLLKIK